MKIKIKQFVQDKITEIGDKRRRKKEEARIAKETAEKKAKEQAVTGLKNLKDEVKQDITREKYNEIVERKEVLKTEAGATDGAQEAIAELEDALKNADTRLSEAEATAQKEKKVNDAKKTINSQRDTPLETLIKKNKKLGDDKDIEPKAAASTTTGNGGGAGANAANKKLDPKGIRDCLKAKIKGMPSAIKDTVKDAFASWTDSLKTAYALLRGTLNTAADASSIGADGGDIQDIDGVISQIHDADNSGAGITAAVLGGVSSVLKIVKTGISLVKLMHKIEDSKNANEAIWDKQEKRKIIKQYIRNAAEIIGGFQGAFAPLTKMIPYFNNIAGLCINGANMALDVVDAVDNSKHVKYMRAERDRIYERIQKKREKYGKDGVKDDAAAKAYNVGDKNSAKAIDEKRRELMKTLGTKNDNIVLRSRNDSKYREIQYGLGAKINDEKDKTKKRQYEALELMEEYREVDKSHKRMRKAFLHNLEDIATGGAGIVSNGLNLVGEILVTTGVGAGVGAGFLAGGMGINIANTSYSIGRDMTSSGYKAVRTMIGSEDNKATTREDMAISLINRMSEVGNSPIWDETGGKFIGEVALEDLSKDNKKTVIRQARNVEHLHNILRKGLDVSMSEMIDAKDKGELKEKIMESFGQ